MGGAAGAKGAIPLALGPRWLTHVSNQVTPPPLFPLDLPILSLAHSLVSGGLKNERSFLKRRRRIGCGD